MPWARRSMESLLASNGRSFDGISSTDGSGTVWLSIRWRMLSAICEGSVLAPIAWMFALLSSNQWGSDTKNNTRAVLCETNAPFD